MGHSACSSSWIPISVSTMLPPMKSMKAGAKAMTKGALLKAIATEHGLKTKACTEVLNSLATMGATEVKKTGVFTVPGVCRIKTRVKPATKAGVRMMFGQETKVKAKPARTVVKAFAVASLKKRSEELHIGSFLTCPEVRISGNPM